MPLWTWMLHWTSQHCCSGGRVVTIFHIQFYDYEVVVYFQRNANAVNRSQWEAPLLARDASHNDDGDGQGGRAPSYLPELDLLLHV